MYFLFTGQSGSNCSYSYGDLLAFSIMSSSLYDIMYLLYSISVYFLALLSFFSSSYRPSVGFLSVRIASSLIFTDDLSLLLWSRVYGLSLITRFFQSPRSVPSFFAPNRPFWSISVSFLDSERGGAERGREGKEGRGVERRGRGGAGEGEAMSNEVTRIVRMSHPLCLFVSFDFQLN